MRVNLFSVSYLDTCKGYKESEIRRSYSDVHVDLRLVGYDAL